VTYEQALEYTMSAVRELLDSQAEPEDNFFECGGSSLVAARIVIRLQDAFGAEVDMVELLDSDSYASFCSSISN
jgi:acyl carrier protein